MKKISKYKWLITAMAALVAITLVLVGCVGKGILPQQAQQETTLGPETEAFFDEVVEQLQELPPPHAPMMGREKDSSFVFRGEAQGGYIAISISDVAVTVVTAPNEPVKSVVEKVAEAINTNSTLRLQGIDAQVNDYRITLTNVPEYRFSLCTTDRGLETSPKPQQLSCMVNVGKNTVVFQWQNPESGYDRVHIVELGVPIAEKLPGPTTNFTYRYTSPLAPPFYTGIHSFHVIGILNEMPSCAAMCEVFLEAP